MAPIILRAWGFGVVMAGECLQPFDDLWTDPDEVCQPLATLAAEVSDVGALCGLIEAFVTVLDLVPRPCCAGAHSLCALVCTVLARLGEHPSCPPHILGSATQGVLHIMRRRCQLFGVQLLPGGDHEAVDCCPLFSTRLARLASRPGDSRTLLLRVLARTHTASEAVQIICKSPPASVPLLLGTVVQEAVLGLGPILRILAQGGQLSDLAPEAASPAKSTLALFRCWQPLPTEAILQATGAQMQAATLAAPTAIDWQFFLVMGLLLGWPAIPGLVF